MTRTRFWDEDRRCWRSGYALNFTGPHAECSLLDGGPDEARFRAEHHDNRHIVMGLRRGHLPTRREMRARGFHTRDLMQEQEP